MKTIEEIRQEVEQAYPETYLKDLCEAIFDAKVKIEWFKTKDAFNELGKDVCKEKGKKMEEELEKVENKLKFVIKHFNLK